MEPYNDKTQEELVSLLRERLEAKPPLSSEVGASRTPKGSDLVRQLEAHQIELEMQNRELRESHQQLEESRNRYADLYDSSPVGYLTLDETGCILEINLTGASMLGSERKALEGMPFVLFLAPAEASTFLNHIRKCFSLLEPMTMETTLLQRGKPPMPLQLVSVVRSDPARSVQVCRTTLIDFRERKQVEEALRESEERFRQLAENISEVFWMMSADKKEFLYMSPAYEKVWGRTCESVYRRPNEWADAIHPEDRETIRQLAANDQITGRHDREFRIVRPDGSVRWIRDRAFPVKDKSGHIYRITGIAEDITDRKRAEAQIRFQASLLDQVLNVVIAIDIEQKIVSWNNYAELAFGWKRDEALGRKLFELIIPSWNLSAANEVLQILREAGQWEGEIVVGRKDGSTFPSYFHITFFRGERGEIIGSVGVGYDITERKKTEESLRKREAQLQDAQKLAHIGSWEWDIAEDRVVWSDELHRIWGVSRQDFRATYEAVLSLVHPDDLKRVDCIVDKAYREHEPYVCDHRIIRPDGTERIVQSRGVVVADEMGRVVRMFGTGQDITERKEAEARLAYQADLLMNVHDAIIATDEQLNVTEWNLAAEKIYGWNREEALGRKSYEVVRSQLSDAERSTALKLLAEGGDYQNEVIHHHRDGRPLFIQGATISLRDESGKIIGYVSANRDMTERRQAEESLRAAKEFSENMIQTANVMILSLDSEGNIDIFNQAAERITGYTRLELKGRNWFETLVPRDRYPHVWKEFNRLVGGGVPKTFDNPILTKTGEERYIMWQNSQIRIDGRVIGTISFGNDVTGRKRAEEALHESDERFHLIARATNDAVWDWDLSTNRVWWNESFKTLFGYRDEEIEPGIEAWSNRLHPDEKERVLSSTHAAIARGERFWSGEYRFRRADGSYATIFDRAYVVHVEKGKAVRMVGAMMDMTERKRAEEALADSATRLQSLSGRLLEAQEAERRRIARELHDEIGQSLTAIKIQLDEMGRRENRHMPNLKECLQGVDQALEEVRNLSLNLHPPQLEELGLIAALRWHLDRQATAAKLTPQFSADPLPGRLHSDLEIACFRVAQEALTNVIRHAEARAVSIEVRRRGSEVHLTVQDDGRGFDVAAARKHALQGESMGLTSMQERMQLVGGRLEFRSAPEEGTVIHAVFPLVYTYRKPKRTGGNDEPDSCVSGR